MEIAITGASGFLGRHILRRLVAAGHSCRCWHRPSSQRFDLEHPQIEWVEGQLQSGRASAAELVANCDALVHAALDRPGSAFRGGEGDLETFASNNIVGSLRLFEAARAAQVGRVIFISSCAVHERILDDRPLDETHPLWATTHYGAHKAAIEQFVHSYGLGLHLNICALRPCGIYGIARPLSASKWYPLVSSLLRHETVTCEGGGKVVHADDVAQAVELLLVADGVAGEAYNCCDGYVSDWDIAHWVKQKTGSTSQIRGQARQPKHQIVTEKLRQLEINFGGRELVNETVSQLIAQIRAEADAER